MSSATWPAPTSSSIRPSSCSTRRAPPELEAAPPTVKRNIEHLRSYASREPEGKPRAIRLRFYTSPTALLGDEKVEAIEVVRNELVDGRAVATDDRETIPCGIVFRSVGYRGTPIEGLPFDEGSWTVPNDGGHVLGGDGLPLAGVYCAGWIKRGPTGVIGTNKKDASETVERLVEDAAAGKLAHGDSGGRGRRAPRGTGRPRRHAGGLGVDRRDRAHRGRAARSTQGQARRVGCAPRRGGSRHRRPLSCLAAGRAFVPTTVSDTVRCQVDRCGHVSSDWVAVARPPSPQAAPPVERLTRNRHHFRLTENGV